MSTPPIKAENFSNSFTRIRYLPGIVLALLSVVIRFKALQQTTFGNGWDAYFYLIQLKSWIEEGSMHTADQSLIYPLLRLVNYWAGDYVLAYKMTAALLAGLATFAIFQVALRWSKSLSIALLIGSISLFSPHLTYFAAQYPKNLLGLVLLFFFLGSRKEKRTYESVVYLIIGFFCHRLTFGVAMIFGLAWLILEYFSLKKVAILLSLGLLFLVLSYLIPGLPNLTDFERFGGLLSSEFQFAPYSFIQTFGTEDRISELWLGEIIIATLIYFLSILFLCWEVFMLIEVTSLQNMMQIIKNMLNLPHVVKNILSQKIQNYLSLTMLWQNILPLPLE